MELKEDKRFFKNNSNQTIWNNVMEKNIVLTEMHNQQITSSIEAYRRR